MNNYKVEYLNVINTKEKFCDSIDAFNYLLQSYGNINIHENKIKFEGIEFGYDVQDGEIKGEAQRFFHIKLTCKGKANIEQFKLLLKSIRTILTKASDKPPEILWDDLSSELANQAYPIVHEIENMMRKLITKFMLTTIGLAWTKDAVPKEVSESIKTKKSNSSQNYLYEADFIQLSNFLFKEYSTANSRNLIEKLGVASTITELDLAELKELVPQSNWERYFLPIVDCKSDYLQTRWEKLYELRCMVAHNKFIGQDDYEEIIRLAKDVKEKLTQAIENLDKVNVSDEQKEEVAENIASNINALYGDFIRSWNTIQEILLHISNKALGNDPIKSKTRVTISKAVIKLSENGILPSEFFDRYTYLRQVRNYIVHNTGIPISENELEEFRIELDGFKTELINFYEQYIP
ncbi:MAG: hypothetical protein ACXWTY_13890 [Methylobacter sp.]